MPSFLEMMKAYNPATSSLIDNGVDPAMFDLTTQASLNSTVTNTMKSAWNYTRDKASSYWNDPTTFFDDVEKASDASNALLVNGANAATGGTQSASGGSRRASQLTYQNADLAAAYGMNAATAYQEALANTAHQREVADLRAAGLNPVLSATQGRGAGTVSSADVAAASGGSSNSSMSFKEALSNVKSILQVARLAKQIF